MNDATTGRPTKVACSICDKPIKATDAALWTQTPTSREHVHIACMRTKAVELQERPAP